MFTEDKLRLAFEIGKLVGRSDNSYSYISITLDQILSIWKDLGLPDDTFALFIEYLCVIDTDKDAVSFSPLDVESAFIGWIALYLL